MSVWLCCPSARPVAEVNARMEKWRRMGYRIHLGRDKTGLYPENYPEADETFLNWGPFPGFYRACNDLVKLTFEYDSECDWVVCAGDDTDPDLSKPADQIAMECSDHFRNLHIENTGETIDVHPTFGVMQPTGDRWGESEPWAREKHPTQPAYIDRICGSPWIGREFARCVNQGRGPWWPEYFHQYGDEELQCVAQKLGVLWQRRDVIHYHDHCRRDGVARTPQHLVKAYSAEEWQRGQNIFRTRKAYGFPGSECIS